MTLSLLPTLLSLLLLRRNQQHWQVQLQHIRTHAQGAIARREADYEWRASSLGEPSCRFNARSPYLRCAVNPSGPCEHCPHYQPR
ncbi:MAG: hypothetical protein HC910_15310 [Spirulinaceae cyanobacterium SM2_1_0]|nr:hypothetical protein [Spirulinaceae cyanobacterium SM2_1_0]